MIFIDISTDFIQQKLFIYFVFRRIVKPPEVFVLLLECIILSIKSVYGIQQSCQMVIECSAPDKRIPVCVRFDFRPVNEKLFQREQAFFFQAFQRLVIQFIQNIPVSFFPLKS